MPRGYLTLETNNMKKLFELRQEHRATLDKADAVLTQAECGKRALTSQEQTLFDAHMAEAKDLATQIQAIDEKNSLTRVFGEGGPAAFLRAGGSAASLEQFAPGEHPRATEFRRTFAAWMNNSLTMLGGLAPQIEASTPTGPISVGNTSGWDSIGITIPTEVLPFMASYFAVDSFAAAGATQIYTDHTRPLVKPILAAGAPDSVFAENAAPGTSQPFGLSGFTFGGTKYARLVLASYESLMNSELPLQGAILDELLSTLATTLTTATTTALYAALTGASSTLEVGTGGSNDIYSSLIDLRHAVPPRFDLPTNKWMLSQSTLATIRNKRASTSGVPMFDPNTNLIFGREYVLNNNFDSAAAGLVVYGSWADGCFLRRTPVQTRVFTELYSQSGQIGYRTQQWSDAHFMAELAGAAQPPSFQPLYYTSLATES